MSGSSARDIMIHNFASVWVYLSSFAHQVTLVLVLTAQPSQRAWFEPGPTQKRYLRYMNTTNEKTHQILFSLIYDT